MPRYSLGLVIEADSYAEAQKIRASALALLCVGKDSPYIDIKPPEAHRDCIEIYTDGGCGYRRTSIGAWAYVMVKPDGQTATRYEANADTTNNRMEMTAVMEALKDLSENDEAVIYSDSEYVIKGITVWCRNWVRNGWKNAAGNDVINRDLWEPLLAVFKARPMVTFKHVRGHHGVPLNERCDQLCTQAMTALHRTLLPDDKA